MNWLCGSRGKKWKWIRVEGMLHCCIVATITRLDRVHRLRAIITWIMTRELNDRQHSAAQYFDPLSRWNDLNVFWTGMDDLIDPRWRRWSRRHRQLTNFQRGLAPHPSWTALSGKQCLRQSPGTWPWPWTTGVTVWCAIPKNTIQNKIQEWMWGITTLNGFFLLFNCWTSIRQTKTSTMRLVSVDGWNLHNRRN